MFSVSSHVFKLFCGCFALRSAFRVCLHHLWLFYDVFGELFQLVFSCFNFLHIASGFQVVLKCVESL